MGLFGFGKKKEEEKSRPPLAAAAVLMLRQRETSGCCLVAPLTRRENLPTAVRVAAALPASKSWAQAANPAMSNTRTPRRCQALGLPVE